MVVSLDCLSRDVGSIPTRSELLNRSLALNDGEWLVEAKLHES